MLNESIRIFAKCDVNKLQYPLVVVAAFTYEIGIVLPSLKIDLTLSLLNHITERLVILEGGNLTELRDGKDNRQTTLCVAVVVIGIFCTL